jgi:diguanylate cyclase (GGDEF)-like protein/PAS domain S-box-containing protein
VPNGPAQNVPSDAEAPEGSEQAAYTAALAAEALLREHPEALVCGLATSGVIVPLPTEVPLWGQAAIEGRALIDDVVTADRAEVIALWQRTMKEDFAGEAKVRLLNRPEQWMRLHFFDVRELYGVLLGVVIPTEELATEESVSDIAVDARPRLATILEDETGLVLDIDDAFTAMFGYTADDVLGQRVIEHVHPEDQGRAVEGWLQMVSTQRMQQMRLRRRRKDGSWLWVDSTLHNFLNDADRNHVLVEIIDVSAEMKAQDEVKEHEELLQRLMDTMPDGVVQVDSERHVVFHNARLLEVLHCPSHDNADTDEVERSGDDAVGGPGAPAQRDLDALMRTVSAESSAAFDAALSYVFDEGVDRDVEVEVLTPAGEHRRALMSIRPLHRADGKVSGAITNVLDVTDSARVRKELEHRATVDALTYCHNRSSILDALQLELDGDSAAEIAVAFIDLDHFKAVNDTHGHAAGDEVLTGVVDRLKRATRSDDRIGRLGGDEFLLVIRGDPQPEVAAGVAQRVREALANPLETSCGAIEVRASIGIAWTGGEAIGAEELVRRADGAMYRSKEQAEGLPVLAGERQPVGGSRGRVARVADGRTGIVRRDDVAMMDANGGGDLLTRAQAEELRAKHAHRQAALARLGRDAVRAQDLGTFLDDVVDTVASTLEVQLCAVLRLRPDEDMFEPLASVGKRSGGSAVPAGTRSQAGYALSIHENVVTEDLSTETRFDARMLLDEGIVSGMSAVIEADGQQFGVLGAHTSLPRHFSDDDMDYLVAVAQLIGASAAREGKQTDSDPGALHDPLTGLPNRTLALDLLDLLLARGEQESAHIGTLLLDLDRFSLINDSLGHEAGDEVLLGVASRLRQALPPSDTIARLGGDEFLVVCERQDGVRALVEVAERIGTALSRPFRLGNAEHVLTASIGIALAEEPKDTPASLLRDAEAAMYRAKRRGPGRYELFDQTVRAQILSRLRTERELREALERGQLRVHYQPIIETATGRPVAAEALVRWEHPERGLVPPLEFIPIAEETGLIVELGRQVLEQACGQGAAWRERYGAPLHMYVNVSGSQMSDLHFPAEVAETARRNGLPPEALGLEVTESTLIGETAASMALLKELDAQQGMRLVLDDFGTGYSSLSQLKRFPLSVVKVDRSFIGGLGIEPEDAAIMKAIVEMSHALHLTVVAEGVETDAQHRAVHELGCEYVQGYLLCRPMPPEDITEFLDERLLSQDSSRPIAVDPLSLTP